MRLQIQHRSRCVKADSTCFDHLRQTAYDPGAAPPPAPLRPAPHCALLLHRCILIPRFVTSRIRRLVINITVEPRLHTGVDEAHPVLRLVQRMIRVTARPMAVTSPSIHNPWRGRSCGRIRKSIGSSPIHRSAYRSAYPPASASCGRSPAAGKTSTFHWDKCSRCAPNRRSAAHWMVPKARPSAVAPHQGTLLYGGNPIAG